MGEIENLVCSTETGVRDVDVRSTSWAVARIDWHRACKGDNIQCILGLNCSHNFSYSYEFGFLRPRLAASYILRTCVLVFNSLLWIKPEGWRDLPCITALTHCRRLHRSFKFREILLRLTLQRQPKCYSRNDTKTYRYVFIFFPWVKNQCHILIMWALCGLPHPMITCRKACLVSVSLSAQLPYF